jgi:hypothetical protein
MLIDYWNAGHLEKLNATLLQDELGTHFEKVFEEWALESPRKPTPHSGCCKLFASA